MDITKWEEKRATESEILVAYPAPPHSEVLMVRPVMLYKLCAVRRRAAVSPLSSYFYRVKCRNIPPNQRAVKLV